MTKIFELQAGPSRMRRIARPGLQPGVLDSERDARPDAQWKVRQASRLRTSTLQNKKAYD